MKVALGFIIVLNSISFHVFGQLNEFRQRAEADENDRQLNVKYKIKQVNKYFIHNDSCASCRDSSLFRQSFINEEGNTFKRITYVMDATGKQQAVIDTVIYDSYGHLLQIIYRKNEKPYSTNYQYSPEGVLIKENSSTYGYNSKGNVIIMQTGYGATHKYTYNENNQIIRHLSFRSNTAVPYRRQEYSYVYKPDEIIQLEKDYDNHDSLQATKQFNYDLQGNKTKEYTVAPGGQLTLTTSNTFNQYGLLESRGEVSTFFTEHLHEKNEHRIYTYDDEGNQASMTTYEVSKATGKETLVSLQKYHYIKYP